MQIILYTGRQTVPVVIMLLLALIGSMPLGAFHTFEIFPMLNIIVVFYWTVYRPDLVPPVILFLIGLIDDVVMGTPLGLMASVFVLLYGVTLTQRQFFIGKPFYVTWLGFSIISAFCICLIWVLVALFAGRLGVLITPFIKYTVTLLSFPSAAWLLVRIQRYLVD